VSVAAWVSMAEMPTADRDLFLWVTAPALSSGRVRATRLAYSRAIPEVAGHWAQVVPSQAYQRPRSEQWRRTCP